MDAITLGELSGAISLLAGFITGGATIYHFFSKNASQRLSEALKPIESQILDLNNNIRDLDLNTCKNFLVDFLASVDRGEKYDEATVRHFWEVYDHYTIDLKSNSYIHDKVERLKHEGKL